MASVPVKVLEGPSVALRCPACSLEVPPGSRVCPGCGAALPERVPEPTGSYQTAGAAVPGFHPPSKSGEQPRFPPGQVLAGRYRIVAALGKGGMGEVWRADDLTLGRPVALKAVRADVAESPEHLARLTREARLLAALNHPHIATLHGLEADAGARFLVMELVPGQTLAARLARGPLPVAEALPLAAQLADAVATAHGQGILHRDLKPANLMLTPEGRLKVLDFGLAVSPPGPGCEAGEAGLTRSGVVLGTPAYMSPEQAAGEPVDKRADVWAFGCVLFEMLAGRRAFRGPAASDVLAAVLRGAPDWRAFPAGVPARLRMLIERCLRKDSRRRLHDLADARIELEDMAAAPADTALTPPRPTRRRALLTLGGLGIGAAGVMAGRWWPRHDAPAKSSGNPPPVQGDDVPAEWTGELLLTGAFGPHQPEISPDGQWLAFRRFVDNLLQVGVMRLDSGDYQVLTTDRTRYYVSHLCWAPNSARIYYARVSSTASLGVFSVAVNGGSEQLILEGVDNPQPLSDGSLLVHRQETDGNHRILRYWPNDGRKQLLAPAIEVVDSEVFSFRALPDEREVIFWKPPPGAPDAAVSLCALHLETGALRALGPNPRRANRPTLALDPAGREVYVVSSDLSGSSLQGVAIPRVGGGPPRAVLSLPGSCRGLSVGQDGSLFVDLVARRLELLRFPPTGGLPERLGWTNASSRWDAPLHLPDGRILFSEIVSARHRVVVLTPGQDSRPFVQTDQETWLPAAVLDRERVVLPIGPTDRRDLATVSIADGRILGRRSIQWNGGMTSLSASPDGRTLWFASRGVYVLEDADTPRKICAGETASLSADGRFLYVAEQAGGSMRLLRRPVAGDHGGDVVPMRGPFTLHTRALTGNAPNQSGRLAVLMLAPDSYFNIPTVLDPTSGELQPIRLDYPGDIFHPSWTGDGKLLATGLPWQSAIWRYRPVTKGGPTP